MTREEVQKVIDEGGWIISKRLYLILKPTGIERDTFIQSDFECSTETGKTWRGSAAGGYAFSDKSFRPATQEEINQYVNGTDKQP